VVRQVFDWVGRERVSIGEVVRRLNQAGERTRTGKTVWDRTTVCGMLKNPAYHGTAAFGKTRAADLRPRLRTQRGRPAQPRRARSPIDMPAEEWIGVPVPALVAADLFATVQEQLAENRQRARQGQRGARYLLQGLICCALCGYAYYGQAISPSAAKYHDRHYAYYRCVGSDAHRFGGQRLCYNKQIRTDLVDLAVWTQVRGLLEHPERLRDEYQRRLDDPGQQARRADLATTQAQIRKLEQGIGRLIDSYAEGLIEKEEFAPRLARLKERVAVLETQATDLATQAALESDLRLIIGHLDDFAATVRGRLDQLDWETQRGIIRTLVKRVEIEQGQVNVVFRIGPGPLISDPDPTVLQHCGRGERTALGGAAFGGKESAVFNVPCVEPAPQHRGVHHDVVKQPVVIDLREAGADIPFEQVGRRPGSTQHPEALVDGVRGAPPDAKPIRVAVGAHLGEGVQGKQIDRLHGPIAHGDDAQGAPFPVPLGDVDPAGRERPIAVLPQALRGGHLLVWSRPNLPVHAGGAFAMVLRHPPHGQDFGRERVGEQVLQSAHLAPLARLRGLHDACLQPTHHLLRPWPVNAAPVGLVVGGRASPSVCRDHHPACLLDR
jgi:Recombinase/Recombinase zinc beta ribbon domain